jgi:hypothetical protein
LACSEEGSQSIEDKKISRPHHWRQAAHQLSGTADLQFQNIDAVLHANVA